MKNKIKFNINDPIYVKLTEKGLDFLTKYWAKYCTVKEAQETIAKDTINGYTRFNTWQLMSIFGSQIYMGGDNMFETNVLFDETDLKTQ